MKGSGALLLALLLATAAAVGVIGVGAWRSARPAARPTVAAAIAQATPALTNTPTTPVTPSATPALTATPTPTPAPLYAPAAPATLLTGIRHEWQTWNNCGPATLAMNLSFFGSPLTQADIGAALRPYPDDKNVSPHELVDFAQSQGFRAAELVNGNDALLRTLVSNGIPVLLETWHEPEPGNGLGHYRLLVGYDESLRQWTLYDTFDAAGLVSTENYAGIRMEYARLAAWWKIFNRAFVLVHLPEQAPMVAAILADFGVTPAQMWMDAEVRARAELALDANDAFAWFNLGGSLIAQGRSAEAAAAFDQAQALGLPERMLWYQFQPFEAYLAEGRPQDVLALTDAVLRSTESIEEIYYWRARALLAIGDAAGAQAAVQRALTLAPTFPPALELSSQLGSAPSG